VAEIEIYSSPFCGYCSRAKALLDEKGVAYTDVNVMLDRSKRQEMEQRSGRSSVPQIFIDGKAIGGCDELYALESAGDLNPLLGLA